MSKLSRRFAIGGGILAGILLLLAHWRPRRMIMPVVLGALALSRYLESDLYHGRTPILRVDSVRVLGDAIAQGKTPPKAFIQASGVGYYGNTGDRVNDEDSPPGNDFPADVCRQWEGEFAALDFPATRKVVLRFGVVLGREGGALPVLEKLTRWFLGGAVGNGRQFMSWIHIADVVRMVEATIEQPELTGTFNATSPQPVMNREFMGELRRALHRPWSPPVPAPFARIGAWVMGTDGDLALTSCRCVPRRFLEHGFNFQFPRLRDAFTDLYPNL